MNPALRIALVAVLAAGLLVLMCCLLYRHFVTNMVMDGGGGMENPNSRRDGVELVKFEWRQSHMIYGKCFSLNFYLENEEPVLTGWFLGLYDGEPRETGRDAFSKPIPWPVTWVQWYELQHALAELELPEYSELSSDVVDATDSEIIIVWNDDGQEKTLRLDGSDATELETQVLSLAQDAYDAARLEAEQWEVSGTARLTRFYWNQSTASENDCFSFSLGEARMTLKPTEGLYFSYRYRTENAGPVSRIDVSVPPEQAQAYLSSIEKELRALELPTYHSPGSYALDAMDSYLSATWSDGGESFTNSYWGEGAQSIYALMVELAEEAEEWFMTQPVPEGGWKCGNCGMANGSNVFCAECGSKRPARK